MKMKAVIVTGGKQYTVAEDFLLLYDCDFVKNEKYVIVLDIN